MTPLPILWKRLVDKGETCPRCGSTERNVVAAVAKLESGLQPLGICPVLRGLRRPALSHDGTPLSDLRGHPGGHDRQGSHDRGIATDRPWLHRIRNLVLLDELRLQVTGRTPSMPASERGRAVAVPRSCPILLHPARSSRHFEKLAIGKNCGAAGTFVWRWTRGETPCDVTAGRCRTAPGSCPPRRSARSACL